ncbi:MAG TPA: condensation domain-containing protein, partial [Thermoanaerobaculia bacterium]
LARGPLARFALLRLDAGEHALLVGMHHVISDGWSLGIFLRELGALYRGEGSALPELPIQYADYASWQRQWLSGEAMETRLAWWTQQLAGAPQVVELPLDRPRPPVQSYRGARIGLPVGRDLVAHLETTVRRLGVTPFMALLAGFATLLSRYGGQSDVVVGTPIANRGRAELEEVIGFFANTLALRLDLRGDPGFGELARRAREVALGAYTHQDVPFERLVSELQPERDLSYSPLFQVMLSLQNLPEPDLDLPGLQVSQLELDLGRTQYDLSLFLVPDEGGLRARLEYARDLFDAATMERLLGHLRTLLAAAVDDPATPVSRLPLLTAGERAQLAAWNEVPPLGPAGGLLHGPFEAQARRTPEAVALVAGGLALTYRELAERSAALAARLRALGAGPEVGVAVCLERTADLVVTLLAVLRAGAFYVPLDPRYPVERLGFLLEDSGARMLVSNCGLETIGALSPAAGGAAAGPQNLAYLIYTSGSTGRPKGVAITHRSAVALVRWAAERFSADELAGVLASTSISFDLSVFELFVPLSQGGTVLLAAD